MTKLNLLGVQRVKALTEILERKYNDAISELNDKKITDSEAVKILAKEEGLEQLYEDVYHLINELEGRSEEAHRLLALDITASVRVRHWVTTEETREKLEVISNNGISDEVKKLKRELEEKKSQLWLVETLEQAQSIVDSPIGEWIE